MCDFKPGDEVIFVGGEGDRTGAPPLGWIGRVVEVVGAIDPEWPLVIGFTLDNWPLPPGGAHNSDHWRKVQRKNTDLSIEAFLTIKPGFEEPRRVSEPKRERVS